MLVHPLAQHVCPPGHAGPLLHDDMGWHTLPTQASPGEHGFPHAPQFCGSPVVFAHPAAQHWVPPVQAGPPLHPVGA